MQALLSFQFKNGIFWRPHTVRIKMPACLAATMLEESVKTISEQKLKKSLVSGLSCE